MARGVLNTITAPALLVAAALALAPAAALPGNAAPACTGATPDDLDALRQAALESPFVPLLRDPDGPVACEAAADGDRHSVVLRWRHGGRLEVVSDASVEFTSQRAEFPSGQRTPRRDSGLAALHRLEHSGGRTEGCGIDWAPLRRAGGTGEWKAEGDTCNCKAALGLKDGRLRLLRFSMAC